MESCEEIVVERADIFAQADPRLLNRFFKYHRDNPKVYERFVHFAKLLRSRGRKKYSAWAIINFIRWDHDISTEAEDFKICNDYIALYPRLLISEDASFIGFFHLKQMKSEGRKLSGEYPISPDVIVVLDKEKI